MVSTVWIRLDDLQSKAIKIWKKLNKSKLRQGDVVSKILSDYIQSNLVPNLLQISEQRVMTEEEGQLLQLYKQQEHYNDILDNLFSEQDEKGGEKQNG